MINGIGYAANHSLTTLKLYEFERDQPKANEVLIDVMYCGVRHSHIHEVTNEWLNAVYPCMPGHEVVGRVVAVGTSVTFHAVDFILSFVSEKSDLNFLVPLLKRNKSLVLVGALKPLSSTNNVQTQARRKSVGCSLIGSIKEALELLDFCTEHHIEPNIELLDIKGINGAYNKVKQGEV